MRRAFLLSLLWLLTATFGTLLAEVEVSYKDQLELDLSLFSSEKGCDIWLSKDTGKTWMLVGKTFKKEDSYIYHARTKGLHHFHIHARGDEKDDYRPKAGSDIHAAILLKALERDNPNILYSNKRTLNISYRIDDLSVDLPGSTFQSWLYVTKTSGLTWSLYGADEDGVSPVPFVAGDDGLYGFKVISSDVAGQKESSPEPGVSPDVLVRIDTVPPVVEIISPQPYDLWETGSTRQIQWQCEDEAMDRLQSVAVYYSIGKEGDWKLIEEGLPSSGGLDWKIPSSKNGRVFLQVRAKDKSGNSGSSQAQPPFFTRNVLEELLDPQVRARADGYFETATICRKNRDYPKAVKYYRMTLQLNPYHVKGFNDLGITLLKMGLTRDGFDSFEGGLKYAPSDERLLGNLARLYIEHDQWEEAEGLLTRLLGLYPRDPNALWLMAEVRMGMGQVDLARDLWTRLQHLTFPEDTRGPRYQVQAKQRFADTLVDGDKDAAFGWLR